MLPDGKTLLDGLAVAVYVTDIAGKITYYNEPAAALWGRRPELGAEMWCGSWRLFWPDGSPMPHEECPMAVALRDGIEQRGVEAIAERPDGSRIRFLPAPTLLRDDTGNAIGAINILMDITDLREAEASAARLAAIVTSSDDAIISKSLDNRITSWNQAASRIFGYSEAEMIGRSITTIIPEELHGQEAEILARLKAGEHIEHYETVRVARSGRRIDISLSVSPVRDKTGTIVGASKVARDISDRKVSERLQNLLIGELHHRVKNTLATVQAVATQSLRHSMNPEQFVASFTGRVDSLSRANSLLTDMRWEGAELGALVRDQVLLGADDDGRITCSGPRLLLSAQIALHLAMVLHELGTNARKHGALATPDGRLTIAWEVRDAPTRGLHLKWTETGGPSVDAPTERGFGTRLIEGSLSAHGGSVAIDYGRHGVVCEITLPLAHVHAAPDEPAAGEPTPSKGDDWSPGGKRILVVEDEALIAMDIEAMLRRAGYDVIGPAGTVEEAKRLLAANGSCEGAILDANLGGHPVDDLASALHRNGIPFAFLTGYGVESLPEAFRQTMLIPKPYSEERLVTAVATLLR